MIRVFELNEKHPVRLLDNEIYGLHAIRKTMVGVIKFSSMDTMW